MQTSSSEGMESLCRRHPLRMRSTPGVDPGYFFGGGADFCILPCPLYHLLKTFYGGG